MNQSRFAVRVGLFVFVGLALMVGLLLGFTKGLTFFKPTYQLKLHARNVAGLRERASVLLAGVAVGTVQDANVAPDGRGVLINLKIDSRYQIHRDARFVIEQVGFLGDQYIAIYPEKNEASVLKPGEVIEVDVPVSIQEVARTASDLLQQASRSVKVLNDAVTRFDKAVLTDETFTNITGAVQSFRLAASKSAFFMDGLNSLVGTNSDRIASAVSNLVAFSEDMDKLAIEMTATVATNRTELTKAVKTLERTTAVLEKLAHNVESGSGLAGSLLAEGPLKDDVSNIVSNFVVLSSNLNRYGILYKPRAPRTTTGQVYQGRSPFNK